MRGRDFKVQEEKSYHFLAFVFKIKSTKKQDAKKRYCCRTFRLSKRAVTLS